MSFVTMVIVYFVVIQFYIQGLGMSIKCDFVGALAI